MLSSVEICAGAGGQALGLETAGFKHSLLIEIDRDACATLRTNRPYWNVIEADLNLFDGSYWKGADLLAGGLPCPPFSIAGQQLGEEDDRNLFPSLLRLVDEVQPRGLLIENVRGLLSDRFSDYRNFINQELDRRGFDPYWAMFNAVDFGVAQSRFRVFLVALRRGETKELEWPIDFVTSPKTVGETIRDLMGARGWVALESWLEKANKPAPTIVGGSKKHGGPDLGPTRARQQWSTMGVDGMGIADKAPDTHFNGLPRLTNRMVARIQSFPDDWDFVGKKTSVYRQIGNALPPGLAKAIGDAVRRCLE